MLRLNVSEYKRIAAGVLGVLILVMTLFSASFIAVEADHDCTGEDCPVCDVIKQCENILFQTYDGTVPDISVIIPVVYMSAVIIFISVYFSQETLVSRKIRLND